MATKVDNVVLCVFTQKGKFLRPHIITADLHLFAFLFIHVLYVEIELTKPLGRVIKQESGVEF